MSLSRCLSRSIFASKSSSTRWATEYSAGIAVCGSSSPSTARMIFSLRRIVVDPEIVEVPAVAQLDEPAVLRVAEARKPAQERRVDMVRRLGLRYVRVPRRPADPQTEPKIEHDHDDREQAVPRDARSHIGGVRAERGAGDRHRRREAERSILDHVARGAFPAGGAAADIQRAEDEIVAAARRERAVVVDHDRVGVDHRIRLLLLRRGFDRLARVIARFAPK